MKDAGHCADTTPVQALPLTARRPSVTAVVLAYGDEPWLDACVDALNASEGLGSLEILLVDNGGTNGAVDRVSNRDRVVTLRPGRNLGFAGGCNLAAASGKGDVLAFINSDALVSPTALHHLAVTALEPGVGIATGSIRLGNAPDRMNSGGNEVHLLGVGWAGAFGEPAERHWSRRTVTSASGAGMAIARTTWARIGAFEDRYFAYHEDAELSLRCWQQGLQVVFVPEAIVVHHYEFSRNPDKLYLLERNRAIFVLTLYETRTLLLLAPFLFLFEAAILLAALRGGWLNRKFAGWAWLVRNRRWLVQTRRRLQSVRTVGDGQLSHLFSTRIHPGHAPLPRWLRPAESALAITLGAVRDRLGSRGQPRRTATQEG
jgi:GT2 family glycosyltransferase